MRLLCAVVFCLLPAFSTAQAASILLLEDPVDPGARYCKSEALRQENLRSGQSALLLEADLLALGHTVLREEIQSSAPETWAAYDLLFFSAGDHPFPLSNPAWRASLRQAVVNGSHLLIEGGDLAYHWLSQDALFNDWVLHADSWQGDEGETLLPVSSHPVATIPHVLPDTLSLAWQSYGDADRVLPAWGAEPVLEWAGNTGEAGVLAYDPDFEPSGGQILFYSFSYEALEETARVLLLENSVNWLLTEVPGSASISGTVTLEGESDHSGTLCRLQPGGLLVWTDSEGAYQFTGLHPNQYELVFLHDGFRSFSRDLELEEGEDSENLNAFLSILLSDEFWNSPELPIPDNDLFGVSDTLTVSLGGLFETLSVFVDIEHSWIGDLIVWLQAPDGTPLLLHNRSGGSNNELYGWYPEELDPVSPIFLPTVTHTDGEWKLHVSDRAGGDTGILHSWCLRIYWLDGTSTTVSPEVARIRLSPNWPNPFNPRTRFSFEVPPGETFHLEIFDTAGRLVRSFPRESSQALTHEMEWDGRDSAGHSLPSGLYLLRLSSSGVSTSRKILLAK